MALHTGKLNGIALCAGNGGLELGLKLALGESFQTVCYVEREAYNARTLVARMDDETLDRAPVWDDLTTFNGAAWRGIVDIISAGFPCQPHSSAGLRKGITDERWIWDYIERIIEQILPEIVWLENVPNLANSGLDRVLGSLSKAGYNSVWDTFSAEETGASQRRERLFIFSYRHSSSNKTGAKRLRWTARTNFDRRSAKSKVVRAVSNGSQAWSIGESLREFNSPVIDVADGVINREADRQIRSSRRSSTITPSNFVFPPFRDDFDGWQKYLAEQPQLEPAVLRGSDGIADRMDRIRTTGNGVVPLVVAYAFISLARIAFKLEE